MTCEESVREIVEVCEALNGNTETCCSKINAFLDYYLTGLGAEPPRDDWPDRVLNPKLNGTSAMLKRLRTALGQHLPHTLPENCVTALNGFAAAGTGFVGTLETILKAKSLNASYTSESDIFSYMTTQFNDMTLEEHARNLKAKFKAMKQSFFDNADVAFELTQQIIAASPYYHPAETRLSRHAERIRQLEARQTNVVVPMVASTGRRTMPVSLKMAEQLLRARCEQVNLADFAVCERTLRNWEHDGNGPAGYNINCRASVQAFLSWVEGYIVHARAQLASKNAVVSFCDNRDSRR